MHGYIDDWFKFSAFYSIFEYFDYDLFLFVFWFVVLQKLWSLRMQIVIAVYFYGSE